MSGRDRDEYRTLPQNLDAEQALLGALLINNDVLSRVDTIVGAEDFHEPVHRLIWETAVALIGQQKKATPITLRPFLGEKNLGGMTPAQYLARLAGEATTIINAIEYAKGVQECSLRRRMISMCMEMTDKLYANDVNQPIEKVSAEFEEAMEAVRPKMHHASEYTSFDVIADQVVEKIGEAYQRRQAGGEKILGLPTGLKVLDERMGGFHPTDLIIIGGRPGQGKTSLAGLFGKTIAQHNLAVGNGCRVGFTTLEMGNDQLVSRIVGESSGVAPSKLRTGNFDEMEFDYMFEVVRGMRGLPIYFDHAKNLTIERLIQKVRRAHKRMPFNALILDYIQLMAGGDRRGGRDINRNTEIGEITGGLKQIGKELGIPVIALSQLSRGVEDRVNKRPMLSDLRDSGSIEADADAVIFCYREEYYVDKSRPMRGTEDWSRWEAEMARVKGHAEVIVAKSRHGGTFTVECGYVAEMMRFVDDPPPVEFQPTATRAMREEKQKKPSFSKPAITAYDTLKTMSRSHLANLVRPQFTEPSGGKLVLQSEFFRILAQQLSEPYESDDEKKKFDARARKLFGELRSAQIAYTHNSDEGAFYFLKEFCSK